jgi:hypothetical protein
MAPKKTVAAKPTSGEAIPDRRPQPVAPFKAHAHGVRATGTVSAVGESHRTSKHVRVTVRHGGPKKDGEYNDFDGGHETTIVLPAHLAKRFPHGKQVSVVVAPKGTRGGPMAIDEADDAGNSQGDGSPIAAAFAKTSKTKTAKK